MTRKKHPIARRLLFVVWVLATTILLLELLARWRTQDVGGSLRFGDIDLLPLPLVTASRARGLKEDAPYLVPDADTGWTIKPSATSPATSVIFGPKAPSRMGGLP